MVLLDLNVLLALCDEAHEFYPAAWNWFEKGAVRGWATCPLTENGFIRIFGHAGHPTGPGSVYEAWKILSAMCAVEGHHFWPDSITLRDRALFSTLEGIGSRGLTDLYLLGLAARQRGQFATFDQHIHAALVKGGSEALNLVPV